MTPISLFAGGFGRDSVNKCTSAMSTLSPSILQPELKYASKKVTKALMLYTALALLGLLGTATNAQTASDVEAKGRAFASCMGCDAQIYHYKNKWYDIEKPGGFVEQGRPPVFDPVLHRLKGRIKWISKNVVYWENIYHCAYDSFNGPRRPVQCTSRGWVDIK